MIVCFIPDTFALFLPAALPTGLRMVDVVVVLLLVLVKHYFQKGPKRCPIMTKFSEIDPWAQTKLFYKKVFFNLRTFHKISFQKSVKWEKVQ